MTQPVNYEQLSQVEKPETRSLGIWISSLLGTAPTLLALIVTSAYGQHWLTEFQLPMDFRWVTGVVAAIILTLVFVVVAVAIELRRWNMRRLIEEIEVDDKRLDEDLFDLAQSLRRLEALGVVDRRNSES